MPPSGGLRTMRRRYESRPPTTAIGKARYQLGRAILASDAPEDAVNAARKVLTGSKDVQRIHAARVQLIAAGGKRGLKGQRNGKQG